MPITTVLFDLDNTIYPASSGLLKGVDVRINEYMRGVLGLDQQAALELRQQYYAEFGTTLRGLQEHHEIDPEHYLEYVHDLAIESFLASDAELDHLLSELRARKAIFTNSPANYARRVLQVLGIERHFSHVFDVRFSGFLPKPDPRVYQSVLDTLQIAGADAILVEDMPRNLPPARALGMTTILIADDDPSGIADYLVPDALAAIRVALDLER